MKSIIDKLNHLLQNDPENFHDYIFKFLMQFFTVVEISQLAEQDLKNFIVALSKSSDGGLKLNPKMEMRAVIKDLMAMREEEDCDHQYILDEPTL